jgi:hypothetical protein
MSIFTSSPANLRSVGVCGYPPYTLHCEMWCDHKGVQALYIVDWPVPFQNERKGGQEVVCGRLLTSLSSKDRLFPVSPAVVWTG